MLSFKEYIEERTELGSIYLSFPNPQEFEKARRIIAPFNIKHQELKNDLVIVFKGISDIVAQRLIKALKKDKIKYVKEGTKADRAN